MNKIKLSIGILLLSFISSTYVYSGTTGKIAGTVVDQGNSEPLIGVNVIIEGTLQGATTDIDGNYIILNIAPGIYTLSFQYLGYREKKITNVKVSVDFTTKISTELAEETLELEEAIVVTSEREVIRKDLTSSQSEVTADDIKSIPVEEFEDVLQLQAGITRSDGGGFHIRGGRSSEIAFWVDGVSVTDAYDGSNGVEIENDAVQSLQVISGTFNAEYGQAMSGIINIVTKDGGRDYTGSVSTYIGDYVTSADKVNLGQGDYDRLQNIDDVNPADIYDFKLNLSGPIPFTNDDLTFFTNFRYNYDDGYLYGKREFNPDGSEGDGDFVAMNDNKWFSTQSKLTYQLTPVMKLRFALNYENRESHQYNHFYRFNPDGDFDRFQYGLNYSATYDHTINATSFYTFKVSRFEKEYEQYVYEDPFDTRYVNNLDPLFSTSAFQFSKGGQQDNHFNRVTETNILKLDFTSQLSNRHLVKAGFEGRLYKLDFLNFNVIDADATDSLFTPTIPSKSNPTFGEYSFEPKEFSFYIQDKMEYDDFILNIGVRFDYFESNGNKLKDPMDPSIFTPLRAEFQDMSPSSLEDIWYEKPKAQISVSPRIGMAFPISERGVIHTSYGHFSQIPEFRLLYDNPGYKISSGTGNLVGNPALKPQKTVMYEIGLQQQLTSDIGVDITGFYRDVRNWVGTSPLNPTYRPDILYSQYENRDYANIRGITVSLNKGFSSNFSMNLSYTLQVAEGNASDPADAFNDIQGNREPRKTIVPLDWDRSHVLNGNVYFAIGSLGASLLGRYESGLPYTPNPVQGTQRGSSASGTLGLAENSERRPDLITFDLQLFYDLYLNFISEETKVKVFMKVFNLFDRRNEQIVWDDTGRATYTLRSTVLGTNADDRYIYDPSFFTTPRRIQFGLSLDF